MAVFVIGPCIANPSVQILGGTIYISAEIRSTAGVLGTPGTSINIQIMDVDGAIHTAYTAMTADSTGKYSYLFASGTDESPGAYDVWIRTVDGGVTSIQAFPTLLTLTGLGM